MLPDIEEWRGGKVARRQREQRLPSHMTRDQLEAVWTVHHREGTSLNAIASQIWQRFGFASQASCYVSLSRRLRREGLYLRDPVDGTRRAVTKHGVFAADGDRRQRIREYWRTRRRENGGGRRCHAARTRGGQPCRSWAVPGTDLCWQHTRLRCDPRGLVDPDDGRGSPTKGRGGHMGCTKTVLTDDEKKA